MFPWFWIFSRFPFCKTKANNLKLSEENVITRSSYNCTAVIVCFAFLSFTMADSAVAAAVQSRDNHCMGVEGMQGIHHNLKTFHQHKCFVITSLGQLAGNRYWIFIFSYCWSYGYLSSLLFAGLNLNGVHTYGNISQNVLKISM